MKKEIYSKLEQLDTDTERIEFLEEKLKEDNLEQETKALVYESLGNLYYKNEHPKGQLFEKAASAWEIVSVSEDKENKEVHNYQKDALKRALKNYRKAAKAYRKANENSLREEAETKADYLKSELKNLSSPTKTLTIAGVVIIFFLSFIFLAQFPTGFAVSPIEESQTNSLGIILLAAGILGAIFVIWRWK
jgi:hypothetical protein